MSNRIRNFPYKKHEFYYSIFLIFILLINLVPAFSKITFEETTLKKENSLRKKLTLGTGEIISSDIEVARIALSDPTIIDLQLLSPKQIFIRAKQLGSSTLLIWEKGSISPSKFHIEVWPDINYLTKQLHELDRNIKIEYIPPSYTLSGDIGNPSAPGPTDGTAVVPGAGAALAGAAAGGGAAGGQNAALTKGKIILKGEVSNADVIAKALQIAGIYVGDQGIKIISLPGGQVVDANLASLSDGGGGGGGSLTMFGGRDGYSFTSNKLANLSRGVIATTQQGLVISFLTVKNSPQISIAIRFYEITKSVSKGIGVNQTLGGKTFLGGTFVGGPALSSTTASATYNLMGAANIATSLGSSVTAAILNPENGLGIALQALQERGEAKVLAEPTLVISNGEPASFLAGGEVPVQSSVITTGGTSQNISYEPFGIRFTILPTILHNNKIHLQIVPEIRDIDTELSNFVAPGSTALRPPAFKTRRTQTQVELAPGNVLAISGLLREDNTRNLRKVPGVGEIPILGTLFRSKTFRKGETELLVVVAPQIINPPSTKPVVLSKNDSPKQFFDEIPPIQNPSPDIIDETPPSGERLLDPVHFNEVGELPPPPDPYIEPEEKTPEAVPSTTVPKAVIKKVLPKIALKKIISGKNIKAKSIKKAPIAKAKPNVTNSMSALSTLTSPKIVPSPQPSVNISAQPIVNSQPQPSSTVGISGEPTMIFSNIFNIFAKSKKSNNVIEPKKDKNEYPEIIYKDKIDLSHSNLIKQTNKTNQDQTNQAKKVIEPPVPVKKQKVKISKNNVKDKNDDMDLWSREELLESKNLVTN